MDNKKTINNDQIYWTVVYDKNENKLRLGQWLLPKDMEYSKRVQTVKSFDQRARELGLHQVKYGYFNITSEQDLNTYFDSLPF